MDDKLAYMIFEKNILKQIKALWDEVAALKHITLDVDELEEITQNQGDQVDGTSGGWILSETQLSSADLTAVLDSAIPFFELGSIGFLNGVGFWVGKDGGVYKFHVGDPAANVMFWDGVDLTITGIMNAVGGIFSGLVQVGLVDPSIIIDGVSKNIHSSNFSSGLIGFMLDAVTGNIEANNLIARGEIRGALFSVGEISVHAGDQMVTHSAGKLYTAFTCPGIYASGTMQIADAEALPGAYLFEVGDFLQIQRWTGAVLESVWFEVTSRSLGTGYQEYTVDQNTAGTSVMPKDSTVIDWGTATDGFISQTAQSGTLGSAPNLSIGLTGATPWNGVTPLVRLGNLNGMLDYIADTMGFALGNSESSLTWDALRNMRISGTVDDLINLSGLVNGYKHVATNGGYSRMGKMGMTASGASAPVWGWQYGDPNAASNIVSNGDFEAGLTDWTPDNDPFWTRVLGPPSVTGEIYCVVPSGDDIYFGGSFTQIGGFSANNIAKYNVVTKTWSALGTGVNDTVKCVLIDGSDVYVGGAFTTAGGSAATRVAKWSSGAWSSVGNLASGTVNDLAMFSGSLYACGTIPNYVRQYSGGNWVTISYAAGPTPTRMLATASYLYVCGTFMYGIYRYHYAGGYIWETMNSGVTGAYGTHVKGIKVTNAGQILIYGYGIKPTYAYGLNYKNGLLVWDSGTNRWDAFGDGDQPSYGNYYHSDIADIQDIVMDGSGNLYLIGDFTHIGNVDAVNFAKVSADGSTITALPSASSFPNVGWARMALGSDGRFYAGRYTSAGSGVGEIYYYSDIDEWAVESTIVHGGTKSARMTGIVGTLLSDPFSVAAGSSYNIEGYDRDGIVGIEVLWSTGSVSAVYAGAGGSGAFSARNAVVTAPVGATTAQIRLSVANADMVPVYFDDISVKEIVVQNFYFDDNGLNTDTDIFINGDKVATEDYVDTSIAALINYKHEHHGRLSLTTAVPAPTADVTTATVLYYTPYVGNLLTLWNGSAWVDTVFTEKSIKLTDAQTGTTTNGNKIISGLTDTSQLVVGMKISGTNVGAGSVIATIDSPTQVTGTVNSTGSASNTMTFKVPAGTNYDVFAYLASSAVKLELCKWTDDLTRATAVTLQDGIYSKNGDKTRLYLGSVRSLADGQAADSIQYRLLWNMYNWLPRFAMISEGTSHSLTTNTALRGWNGATDATDQVYVLLGLSSLITGFLNSRCYSSNASYGTLVLISLDGTNYWISSSSLTGVQIYTQETTIQNLSAQGCAIVDPGYHYFQISEKITAGSNNATLVGAGMRVLWEG